MYQFCLNAAGNCISHCNTLNEMVFIYLIDKSLKYCALILSHYMIYVDCCYEGSSEILKIWQNGTS